MMIEGYKVFVSHSGRDIGVAKLLARCIRACRAQAFLDQEDIEPGDVWRDRIVHEAKSAREMVLLVSPRYLESPFYLAYELGIATSQGKRLIPILFDLTADQIPRSEVYATLGDRSFVPIQHLERYFLLLEGRVDTFLSEKYSRNAGTARERQRRRSMIEELTQAVRVLPR